MQDIAYHGSEQDKQRLLTEKVMRQVVALPGVHVYGNVEHRLPHIVCLGIEGIEPQAVLLGLDRMWRLGLGPALREHGSAAMDVSDGLAKDLARMCAASGCGGCCGMVSACGSYVAAGQGTAPPRLHRATPATTPTVAGTSEANATVKVYDGATLVGTTTANGSGNWNEKIIVTPSGSHVLGNPAADIKLSEYISYTCPHCAAFEKESSGELALGMIRGGKGSIEYRPSDVVTDVCELGGLGDGLHRAVMLRSTSRECVENSLESATAFGQFAVGQCRPDSRFRAATQFHQVGLDQNGKALFG
mgnify:CR=1 FL=1